MPKLWTADVAIVVNNNNTLQFKVQQNTLDALTAEVASLMQPCIELLDLSKPYLAEQEQNCTPVLPQCKPTLEVDDLEMPEIPYKSKGLKIPVKHNWIT